MIYTPKDSNARLIKAPNLPIGFSLDHKYKENTLQLSPGDRIHLYSDGIPDAENGTNQHYGTNRMLETLQSSANKPLDESLDLLLENVTTWANPSKLKDDATLLAIEISEHNNPHFNTR